MAKEFYVLFIKNHGLSTSKFPIGLEAYIIEDSKLTFKKQEKLLNDGFKLIADSMLSYEFAEKYANEHYDAHVHSCIICDDFKQTSLVRGKRWSNYHERYIAFNGYVCERCEQDYEVTGKTIKSDSYSGNYIHFPYRFTEDAMIDFPELKTDEYNR